MQAGTVQALNALASTEHERRRELRRRNTKGARPTSASSVELRRADRSLQVTTGRRAPARLDGRAQADALDQAGEQTDHDARIGVALDHQNRHRRAGRPRPRTGPARISPRTTHTTYEQHRPDDETTSATRQQPEHRRMTTLERTSRRRSKPRISRAYNG